MHFIEVLVVMVNERDILGKRNQWQKCTQKLPMFILDRFLHSRARTQATPPLPRQERPHFQYDEQERS
jgi:hypothetical protein